MAQSSGNIERMLVPIDFSRHTDAILAGAAAVANLHAAQVELLHVWRPPFALQEPWVTTRTAATAPESEARLAERCDVALSKAAKRLRELEVEDVQTRLVRGLTSKTILDLVRFEDYDLVVMGNHGQTGLEHAYLGSVTERVLRRCRVPVLVVPTPELIDDDADLP